VIIGSSRDVRDHTVDPYLAEGARMASWRSAALLVASLLGIASTTAAKAQAAAHTCATLKELEQYPRIRTVWLRAREAAAPRAELMARYRYTILPGQERRELTSDGSIRVVTRNIPPQVSDPTSALGNDAIQRAQRLSRGYYGPNDSWSPASDCDVLHEDFLETHCLYSTVVRLPGEVGLRFRPVRARRDFLDVRGTLWLDSSSYVVHRLEVEYVDGEEPRGTFRLDVADVAVPDGTVRLPVGGPYDLRPSRTNPAKHVAGRISLKYSGFEPGTAPPLSPEAVDGFITAEMTRRHIPGLSLAVVKAGKVVKAKGYGIANRERGDSVTPETVFRIASVSKQFLSAGIMLLAQEGKLSVDDPVSKYFKTPMSWDSITLRHLLTHTSGVLREGPASKTDKALADSVVVQSAYTAPLLFPTGSDWSYSNLGYFALADVIARVSGMPWDAFIAQCIFATQGMTATRTITRNQPNRATGYFWSEKGFLHGAHYTIAGSNSVVRPSGAFQSTVLDLAKWDAALNRDDVLTRATREAMWTPVRLTDGTPYRYGFGWFVDAVDGHRRVSHGGNVSGFTSDFVRFVDDSLTVIMLTNKDNENLDGLADQVAQAFVPALKPKPWHQ
jgi:CubicO group peptidase (beta-lactamase class C family)